MPEISVTDTFSITDRCNIEFNVTVCFFKTGKGYDWKVDNIEHQGESILHICDDSFVEWCAEKAFNIFAAGEGLYE